MTLGPKLFCCNKMAVTRRRSKLWWREAHRSKALVEPQRSRRSKRDLKPSGTLFLIFLVRVGVLRELFYKKNVIFENQFWPVLKYVKNTLNSMVQSVLAKTFKHCIFFAIFITFFIFLHFSGKPSALGLS